MTRLSPDIGSGTGHVLPIDRSHRRRRRSQPHVPPNPAYDPPKNTEAERSILGAILLRNEVLSLASIGLRPIDFFHDVHQRVFAKMLALAGRGDVIDLITLKEELGRAGELDKEAIKPYLAF